MTEPQEKQGEGGALLPPSDLEGKPFQNVNFCNFDALRNFHRFA